MSETKWMVVVHTHAGKLGEGVFDTQQEAADKATEIRERQAGSPFPPPAVSIERVEERGA